VRDTEILADASGSGVRKYDDWACFKRREEDFTGGEEIKPGKSLNRVTDRGTSHVKKGGNGQKERITISDGIREEEEGFL